MSITYYDNTKGDFPKNSEILNIYILGSDVFGVQLDCDYHILSKTLKSDAFWNEPVYN